MTRKTATVSDGDLYGEQTNWRDIPLDSPQWFAWLEAPDHHSFSYALHNHAKGYIDGFVTVRKERRQRGSDYWIAYRRLGDRLCKIYLGPSSSLTQARLIEVAARLRIRDDPLQDPGIPCHHQGGSHGAPAASFVCHPKHKKLL